MKWSFNVLIFNYAAMRRCIPGCASWNSMSLALIYIWMAGEASLSSLMCAGLIPLESRWSCRSLNTRMNLLSDIAFMGNINILLLLYSYNTNRYLFSYWGLQVIYMLGILIFASCGWWSWWTLCCCVVSVVSSVDPQVLLAIVAWLNWWSSLFGTCFPWLFPLIGGRWLLIGLIVKLGHVAK